tara:strand:- start:4565 stop:4978 length:414 start_codon:yes stop_codon:yes gene_type:complete
MGNDNQNINGYNNDDGDEGTDYREQILQLCKMAQGNITTIYWCKQQIRKRLKVLDRLVKRLSDTKEDDESQKSRIESIIKKQTDACKELGDKIETEIESLEAIRVAAKSFGIDIKARLLELDDTLDGDDIDSFFEDE